MRGKKVGIIIEKPDISIPCRRCKRRGVIGKFRDGLCYDCWKKENGDVSIEELERRFFEEYHSSFLCGRESIC